MTTKDTLHVPANIDSATLLAMQLANPDAQIVMDQDMEMGDLGGFEAIDMDQLIHYSDINA